MRTVWATQTPDRQADILLSRRRPTPSGSARLAERTLAALPMPVAVIDRYARLQYWNDQAAALFRMPPILSAEQPGLHTMLCRISRLTHDQRDRIAAFAEGAVADQDNTLESCLCLSFGTTHRVAIRIRGVEPGAWMMIADYWEPFRRRMNAPARQER